MEAVMDGERFDNWARALVTRPPTRRALLGALAAGTLGALGSVPGAAACRQAGGSCSRDGQCCSSDCRHNTCRCDDGRKPCAGFCCEADRICASGACVLHCGNGIKDSDETDVDCGGDT